MLPEVGRVGPVDSRPGQESEGQRENPDKFLGLSKWGGGKREVGRDFQQVEEGGQEPGKVEAAHQVVHPQKNPQPGLACGRRGIVGRYL